LRGGNAVSAKDYLADSLGATGSAERTATENGIQAFTIGLGADADESMLRTEHG
jgi:hypothetical protein